ncbi:MAG: hypothetical protein PHH54_01945 [Candidatus Nanoarchaeia archaeon]|nr:hypothetical protein [Candidatus Nanoarchaeia archaeon]MDD5740724.1 hypothetical protein [Candidatus Nanoarchaeia archaeon]
MAIDGKVQTLGKFLQSRLGGQLFGDVAHALEGSYEVGINGVPLNIGRNQINEAITQFYEQIGFKRDTKSKLEDPVFYKGQTRNENIRCIVLSDNRRRGGEILISVAPLYSTNKMG